jgi:4-methoxybenzoate monooxygenase (O-demethylating)
MVEIQVDCPVSDVDPWSDEFLDDPFPSFDRLREAGPVVYLERHNVWAVTGFAQARHVLSDPGKYCNSGGVGLANHFKSPPWRPLSITVEADPPLHTRTRAVLNRVMSPATMRDLRDRFQADADAMVEPLVGRGEFDAQRELADLYPPKVFADALGLAAEGRENLVLYGNMVFGAMGPDNELQRNAMAHASTVVPWIQERCKRAALSPGGMGAKIYESADKGDLTEDEAGMLVRAFLSAGLDSTMNGIGATIHCLAARPEQWESLVAEPSLARAAFDETLRFDAPAPFVFRTTTEEVNLFGATIPKHEKVLVFLNAANRDPAQWVDPGRYDIRRKSIGHVGFGHGIHACVGQMVARLEAECVLTALASRAHSLAPAGPARRRQSNGLRGYSSIPVRVTAR